jgi:hypothetical protein
MRTVTSDSSKLVKGVDLNIELAENVHNGAGVMDALTQYRHESSNLSAVTLTASATDFLAALKTEIH